jgi:hypothetical protein
MTRKSPLSGALQIRLPKPTRVHFSTTDLEGRRSRREALRQVEQLRQLLSMFDAGSIGLDEFGFGAGLLGAKLGRASCSGKLAS